MLLEFGTDEWIKIIHPEVGLGHLSKEFLMVGSCIMTGLATTEEKDPFVKPRFFRAVVGLKDIRVVEAEDLVVIGMSKFVQNDVGVLGPSASVE